MVIILSQVKGYLIALAVLSVFVFTLGVYVSFWLSKREYLIKDGILMHETCESDNSYFTFSPTTISAQQFVKDTRLQEYNPSLKRLEHIPSGKVSKLFINGRGSWRLTQGNILTREELEKELCRELSHNLK